MAEILCAVHNTPLKHKSITVGTTTEGWYCSQCDTYYVIDNSPWIKRMTYEGKKLAVLEPYQIEAARGILMQDKGEDGAGNNEKPKEYVLTCCDCGKVCSVPKKEFIDYTDEEKSRTFICPDCINRRSEEKELKYKGFKDTMGMKNTRHVDTKGRVVKRTGGEFEHISEVFIPKENSNDNSGNGRI